MPKYNRYVHGQRHSRQRLPPQTPAHTNRINNNHGSTNGHKANAQDLSAVHEHKLLHQCPTQWGISHGWRATEKTGDSNIVPPHWPAPRVATKKPQISNENEPGRCYRCCSPVPTAPASQTAASQSLGKAHACVGVSRQPQGVEVAPAGGQAAATQAVQHQAA